MQKYLGFSLFAGALATAACGTSAKTGGSSRPNGTGGGASDGTAGGSYLPGGGGPQINVPNPNGGSTGDNDPGNPNITHAKCTAGMCADFPTTPIMGDGVPSNVATRAIAVGLWQAERTGMALWAAPWEVVGVGDRLRGCWLGEGCC